MAMVLTPILKNPLSEKLNSGSRVTFNIPDEDNIIEYLKNSEIPHSTKLNSIKRRILAADTPNEVLLKWFKDFKDNILFLEHNEGIGYALLSLKWYIKDDNFVSIYHDLILNLVTAHPVFVENVIGMILKIFYTVQDSNDVISEFEERYFQNGHKLLQNVITLVPMCEYPLCSLMSKKFPYTKSPTKVLYCYVQNLLHISSYFSKIRPTILACIVRKIIDIDSCCSRDTIQKFELQKEEEENQQMDNDLSSDQANSEKDTMAYPVAQTLDRILNLMYKYIWDSCFQAGGESLDWKATRKLYKELLTVFDKFILSAPKCCHVQYLMFYICGFKQEICDGFLDYLWKKVQDPSAASVLRQHASFYIGSYLSRAKYINISTVVVCLELMCNWIHSYIGNHTSQVLKGHVTFYSVCETVFYVFAFRSQELMELDKGFKFLRGLNFDRIVTCRLNPLQKCDKNIVQNFANIARNFQIAYVYPVIEKNNRNLLYTDSQANGESAGAKVKIFFPFDPYLLKRSKHWIEANYRIYNHCHKEEEVMDTVDEEETNTIDLFSYSSSPGFKKSYLFRR